MRLSHGLYEVCIAGIAANVGGTGASDRFFPSSPEPRSVEASEIEGFD